MGITVNRKVNIRNYGMIIDATWASIATNSVTMTKIKTGVSDVPPDSPKGTIGEPIYKYRVSCKFNIWLDENARNNENSPVDTEFISIEYDEVPTGNIYELLYEKFKLSRSYFDPRVDIKGDT